MLIIVETWGWGGNTTGWRQKLHAAYTASCHGHLLLEQHVADQKHMAWESNDVTQLKREHIKTRAGKCLFDQEPFPEEHSSPLTNNKNYPQDNMAEIPEIFGNLQVAIEKTIFSTAPRS